MLEETPIASRLLANALHGAPRRFALAFLTIALGLGIAACQTTSSDDSAKPTIAEAKQTLADFSTASFKAPPRNITDILTLLERRDSSNLRWRTDRMTTARQTVHETTSSHEKLVAYFARARAAGDLGWSGAQLRDLRNAVHLIEQFENNRRNGLRPSPSFFKAVKRDAGWAEFSDGNFLRTVSLFQSAADYRDGGWQFDQSNWRELFGMAIALASAGELRAAQEVYDLASESSDKAGDETGRMQWSGVDRRNPWRAIYKLSTEAALLELQGNLAAAERRLRQAIDHYDDAFAAQSSRHYQHGRDGEWQHIQRSKLARILLQQGRVLEAEVTAREALNRAILEHGRNAKTTAQVVQTLVDLLVAGGRFTEALDLNDRVIEILQTLETPNDSRLLGAALFQRAEIQALRGHWPEALRTYADVEQAFADNQSTFDRFFAANPTYLLTRARIDDSPEVADLIKRAHAHSHQTRGRNHRSTAELHAVAALHEVRLHRLNTVSKTLDAAVSTLVDTYRAARSSGDVSPVELRRVRFILEDYLALLTSQQPQTAETIEKAFTYSAFLQGQAVQAALARALVRQRTADSELRELIRTEQDAEHQLEASYRLLAEAYTRPAGASRSTIIDGLRERIADLSQSKDVVRQSIERRFPRYVELINPSPPDIREVQALLRPGESLLSFYVAEDRTYVWAIPATGQPAFHVASLGGMAMSDIVANLRLALEPSPHTIGDIPRFRVTMAHELYRRLLAPVEAGWHSANALVLVQHHALSQIPLAILPTEMPASVDDGELLFSGYRNVAWLGLSHAMSTLPSVTSLRILRTQVQTGRAAEPFVGFGDPIFSPQQQGRYASTGASRTGTLRGRRQKISRSVIIEGTDSLSSAGLPRLPDTADELLSVAQSLGADPARATFLRENASEDRVRSLDLTKYRVVSFATHGLIAGDIDGLHQPALALSSPTVTGGREDGLLTMEEITTLRMNADWVVLSACNTAAGDGEGAEAMSGLGRAFLYAGSRALFVSQWPVHSAATTELMRLVFGHWSSSPTVSRAEAVRRAMDELIAKRTFDDGSGNPLHAYAHPIFWAAFVIVGEGNAEEPGDT